MEQSEKLKDNLLEQITNCKNIGTEYNLDFKLDVQMFPIKIEFTKAPDTQLSMLGNEEETKNIIFYFGLDIYIDINSARPYCEKTLSKLKNASKKCVMAYYMLLHSVSAGKLKEVVAELIAEAYGSIK